MFDRIIVKNHRDERKMSIYIHKCSGERLKTCTSKFFKYYELEQRIHYEKNPIFGRILYHRTRVYFPTIFIHKYKNTYIYDLA